MTDYKIINIPIENLIFDPENPRLPETLRAKKDLPEYEKSVINWMLQFENVTELMGSIGEKGFFPAEPILVVTNADEKFEVVEGNRRLTAVKLLNHPEQADKKKKAIEEILKEAIPEKIPNSIPAIIFDERDEVLSYLGYKHITGVQSWDSLAKAKYLKQLLATLPENDFYTQCRTLAKIIGSKASYVRLLLVGVEVYYKIEEKNFFDIEMLGEENFEFGVFYTALNRSNISKYVGIDFDSEEPTSKLKLSNLKDLTSWIFEKNSEGYTRLGESRNLPKLNKILDAKFPKALASFKDAGKSLNEAVRLTDHPLEIFQNSLNDSLSSLEISRNYIHEVNEPKDTQADTLKEIFQLSRDLYKLIQSKMLDDDISLD